MPDAIAHALSPLLAVLVEQVFVPALWALLSAAALWVVPQLPGPLRRFLEAFVHERDIKLLVGALGRGAAVWAEDVVAGRMTAGEAAGKAVSYARRTVGETLAKLAPSEDALGTIAAAAVQEAVRALPPPLLAMTSLGYADGMAAPDGAAPRVLP